MQDLSCVWLISQNILSARFILCCLSQISFLFKAE